MSFMQIEHNSQILEVINKSKFLAYSFCVNTDSDILNALEYLNKNHPDATHICYAYKLGGKEKCSDDGEPQGTAGKPILDVIKKSNFNNVLVAVVRYFGGVKLGAGGLLRAYSNSASKVLVASGQKEAVECKKIQFSLPITATKKLALLQNITEIKKVETTFCEAISIEAFVALEQVNQIKQKLQNLFTQNIDFFDDDKIFYF